MMADGMVSIGDGKAGNEASPSNSNKRRGSNFGGNSAPAAPVAASRVKRSPQGSIAGESSTKGSERDDMEEVSNEEGRATPACGIGVGGVVGVCLFSSTFVRFVSCTWRCTVELPVNPVCAAE